MRFKLVEDLERNTYTEEDIKNIIEKIFKKNKFHGVAFYNTSLDDDDPIDVNVEDIDIEEVKITNSISDDSDKYVYITANLIEDNQNAKIPVGFEFYISDIDEYREEFEKYIVDTINDVLESEYFELEDTTYWNMIDSDIDLRLEK